jgi:hypothetical protein
MRRHRIRLVLLCLVALVWCQLAAAAQACTTGDAAPPSVAMPGCDEQPDAEPCMATDCPAGQALKDASTAALAFVAPVPARFVPVLTLGSARGVAARDAAALPTGPPAHFLGRLLI